MTDLQAVNLHKAEPLNETDEENGAGSCKVCGQRVKRVFGGSGRIWIHSDSGAVVGKNPPS